MKKLSFSILALSFSAVLFTSCGGGVSEEVKKELAAFEAEWTKAGEGLAAFGKTIAAEDSAMQAMTPHMVPDSLKPNATPEQLHAVDSLQAVCDGHKVKTAEIKSTFDGFMAAWDKDGKDWASWKEKVEKGEVKEEEVKTAMTDWKKKCDAANANVTEWQTALEAVKSECGATCAAQKDAVAAIPTEPVKEEKGKGKKK